MKPKFAPGWKTGQRQCMPKTSKRLCPTTRRTSCLFDLVPPLQYRGAGDCRKNWAEWFSTFQGPVGYEITELSITSGDDVALCHSLNRIYGARTTGEQTDVWVRATVGLRKSDGKWTIMHEHYSVPFYMEPPYKASLDLKP
jgi:ketosteroid isomerase-like protein